MQKKLIKMINFINITKMYNHWEAADLMILRDLKTYGRNFFFISCLLKRTEDECRVKYYQTFVEGDEHMW
jgi:hypothetical protein